MTPQYTRNRLVRHHVDEGGELRQLKILRYSVRSLLFVADVEIDESGERSYWMNYQPVAEPLEPHLDIEAYYSLAPVKPQTPPDVRAMVRAQIPSIAVAEDATRQLRRLMELAR